MTVAERRIEKLKISRAFDKVCDNKEDGFKTIAKYSGANIEDLKKWYNEEKINPNFFHYCELAEANLLDMIW